MKILSGCVEIQPGHSKDKPQVANCTGTRLPLQSSRAHATLPASLQPSVTLDGGELAVPYMHNILIYQKGTNFFFLRGCLIIG